MMHFPRRMCSIAGARLPCPMISQSCYWLYNRIIPCQQLPHGYQSISSEGDVSVNIVTLKASCPFTQSFVRLLESDFVVEFVKSI